MATWIAHMRIAEYFMNNYSELDNTVFLVGNIGPDCGVPNENWSKFIPDASITHWKTDENKSIIDAEGFKRECLRVKNEKYSFYLGYYFHLLTDIEWSKLYDQKKSEPIYADLMETDKNFIVAIKKDWYGQDRVYLQENRESVFFTKFAHIDEFPNIYFDFYSDIAFIRQIKYITNWYMSEFEGENPNRPFPYLSKDEMDSFVDNTISFIATAAAGLL